MPGDRAVWEHRLFTHLTTIKLANQILERQPGLSAYQCRLVRAAIRATDELTADLLERHQAPGGRDTSSSKSALAQQVGGRTGRQAPPRAPVRANLESAFAVRRRATRKVGLSPDQREADKQDGTGHCGQGEQAKDEQWEGRNPASGV